MKSWKHALSSGETLLIGQPGFFSPLVAQPGIAATSFYDTAPLYDTLAEVVDFTRLDGRGEVRMSVGATDVETGGLVFFDTSHMIAPFGPQHVVASGSLPPGFPPTEIGGRAYWDGGCISNSPLQAVQQDTPLGHVVVFVIDLWSASGPIPETMSAVEWRTKQIRYASSTPHHVDALATKLHLRQALSRRGYPSSAGNRLDVVHIVYDSASD